MMRFWRKSESKEDIQPRGHWEDFWRVVSIIHSCNTIPQNNVAYNLVWLFRKKYPAQEHLFKALLEEVDFNLEDIVRNLHFGHDAQRYEKLQTSGFTQHQINSFIAQSQEGK